MTGRHRSFDSNPLGQYVLGGPDGHTPIAEPDLLTWGRWMQGADVERMVEFTGNEGQFVSTVFLGLDHNFFGGGPPLVFETMVFGGAQDGAQERYSTWAEAEAGHRAMCLLVFGKALERQT
jgi:hypothetical protein